MKTQDRFPLISVIASLSIRLHSAIGWIMKVPSYQLYWFFFLTDYLTIQVTPVLVVYVSIVMHLARSPQVHVISQANYMNNSGNNEGNKTEVVVWLEKWIRHLKDGMSMVNTFLEKIQQKHLLFKPHLPGHQPFKT